MINPWLLNILDELSVATNPRLNNILDTLSIATTIPRLHNLKKISITRETMFGTHEKKSITHLITHILTQVNVYCVWAHMSVC